MYITIQQNFFSYMMLQIGENDKKNIKKRSPESSSTTTSDHHATHTGRIVTLIPPNNCYDDLLQSLYASKPPSSAEEWKHQGGQGPRHE